ncbi:VIT family protein [Microbacterium sp. 13-71-7]|jgi:VIT1/CCC1 family predicted Fe2+/Mn2+ transporter|uniref:VIT1/CCC1 transporter family protein n=1 Tax=Microbacterium sp. 13-71-7 TaxID=1970399 RepID=UPI000BC9D96E|nr:VIT family protein [Microbacterium sp. 13-71-7]OZB83761.1 MAG: hypothetical protein B7X32_09360 [Microbacterium sp. 13-71-7]
MTATTPSAARVQRLNRLRAGVLGANDGIVSVATVVVGVASATASAPALLSAGVAALVGGAVSMALGEYVSVSSQRDSQRSAIDEERGHLASEPERELEELAASYQARGLTEATARQVAKELTAHDALAAHIDVEHRLAEDEVVSAWGAAFTSAISFFVGGIVPFLAILLLPATIRIPITFGLVLIALAATGWLGARLGNAKPGRAAIRVVIGGTIALAATYGLGSLLGTSGG